MGKLFQQLDLPLDVRKLSRPHIGQGNSLNCNAFTSLAVERFKHDAEASTTKLLAEAIGAEEGKLCGTCRPAPNNVMMCDGTTRRWSGSRCGRGNPAARHWHSRGFGGNTRSDLCTE